MNRGRPRSEEARQAILKTALEMCMRDGYPQLTIKALADEAGVGRQTVYRWWDEKSAIVVEALIDLRERELPERFQETGDTLVDVEQLLATTYELTHEYTGKALVGLMADAQSDAGLSDRLQETVIGPRRDALRDILGHGVETGQLRENVPLPLVVDFAFGTMWYRMLSRHAPVDRELARDITDAIAIMLAV